jgi:hypothetical protein
MEAEKFNEFVDIAQRHAGFGGVAPKRFQLANRMHDGAARLLWD